MRESDLLEHIYSANRSLDRSIVIPPGDDLGGVRIGQQVVLAGVDQLVDGLHFRLEKTPIALIGRKAITRCLSDAAATASIPVATLVAATLPPDFGSRRANALFDAMRANRGGSLPFRPAACHRRGQLPPGGSSEPNRLTARYAT